MCGKRMWITSQRIQIVPTVHEFLVSWSSTVIFVSGGVAMEEKQKTGFKWNRYVKLELVPHPDYVCIRQLK